MTDQPSPYDDPSDDSEPAFEDIPEHRKPENLEKLKDYGKDQIPPGVA